MAQAKTIQLLRSSAVYANLEAAKSGIQSAAGTRQDGELLLGRYWSGTGSSAVIKSVIGIYHKSPDLTAGENDPATISAGWTFIQDITSSNEGIEQLQSELDATQTGAGLDTDGSYIGKDGDAIIGESASLADAINDIANYLQDLDANTNYNGNSVSDDSKVIVAVKQVDGQVTSAESELSSVKVASVSGTNALIAAEDTLGTALGKLQAQIEAMDSTVSTAVHSGDVITSISETNGVVTADKANLTDVVMTGYSKTSDTGAIAATDTLEQAFSKVENAIAANAVTAGDDSITIGTDGTNGNTTVAVNVKSGEHVLALSNTSGSTGLYTDIAIKKVVASNAGTNEVVGTLGTNVKEAYQLIATDGTQLGQQINIYKDSALQEVYLGASTDTINASTGEITKNTVQDPQSMNFAYQLADGTYSLTKIDVSKFLTESEFSDGLQVNGGVVSVKVGNGIEISDTGAVKVKRDSTCERFLTVGPDGVKLSGVQNAIDAVKVTTDNTGATYVNLAVDNATGRALTLTNTMQAMATADSTHQGLAEASDVKTYVDNAVQAKNVSAEGDNYVSATAANNEVTVSTDVQNLAFTQGSGSTDSTLTGTASSLADGADIATKVSSFTNARISEEIAKLDSSVAATAEANNQYSVLTGVTETNGKLTAKTEVSLAAVAKTGAAADVSVTDTAGKLTSTNVEDALAEIVDKADASLNSVSSTNGAIAVGTRDANKNQALTFQIGANCAKEADGTTNMLTIENDGLVLSDTWDCGTF